MKYTTLPGTDLSVSKLCLGTMTFGNQNTEAEGHAQMDLAHERGINFFDTAELYPVPATPQTYADTERIMGTWFKKTGKRDQIVLASKIAGSGAYTAHIRDHEHFSPKHLREALEGSLKRLQTDYLDLYQLHWPERKTNFFSVRGYRGTPENDPWEDNFEAVLATLGDLISEGKIKHIGLSNETPWGLHRSLALAEKGFPKMITVQNPYNLLNRLFEVGNAEICLREGMGLLAYSPLGFGRLTGKYRDGMPEKSRFKLFPNLARFNGDNSILATEHYFKIAEEFNLSLTQMALAFVTQQPFVTSNIIGATTLEQLNENIDSIDVSLSKEILKAIETVQEQIPNPAP